MRLVGDVEPKTSGVVERKVQCCMTLLSHVHVDGVAAYLVRSMNGASNIRTAGFHPFYLFCCCKVVSCAMLLLLHEIRTLAL